jgi:hypothetical protein
VSTPSPHLDLDALADALAGEGSATDADHLAGCGDCAARLDELRAADAVVLDRLTGLARPPLPADVAARLDAALAAEEPLAQAQPAPPAQHHAPSVTALPARRARALPSWLPAAAAAVLVIGGGGAVVSQLGGTSGGSESTASSAAGGAAESAEGATAELLLTASGTDWADPQAPGTALPVVLGGQARRLSLDEGAPQAQAEAESEAQDAPAPAAAPLPDELARLRTREGLDACLSSLLAEQGPGVQPLAVDFAGYDGQPALAVVLPDPEPASAAVYVVGSDCSAADPDLLLFRRAPLP